MAWGTLKRLITILFLKKVLAGTCLIGTVLKAAGDVDFIGKAGVGSINVAAQSGKLDVVQEQILADFKAANLNPNLTDNF